MNKKIAAILTLLFTTICAFSLERLNIGSYKSNNSNINFRFDCYDDNSIRITDDTKVLIVMKFPDMDTMLKVSVKLAHALDEGKVESVMQVLSGFEEGKIKYEYKQFPNSNNYYIDAQAFADLIVAEFKKSSEKASPPKKNDSGKKGAASKTLYVWSFTDEVQTMIEKYYAKDHPDVRIEYSLIPTDQFANRLDMALYNGSGVPDIITLEDSFVRKYVEQGDKILLDVTKEYSAVKNKMIPYPAEIGSYKDRVYALSWQACPGAFFYRRSYAKKYLGTDNPKEVQKYLKDWNTFLATARKLNKNSNGRCVMVSSLGDISKPYFASRKEPWIVNNKLNVDPAVIDYMKMCKTMKEEGLEGRMSQWSEGWFAGMKGELRNESGEKLEVFGYFFPTWGLHYVIKPNCGFTDGDWAMCEGPAAYSWGGTWVAAYKGTKNPELAKEFLMYIGTSDKMHERWAKDTGDLVSNNNAINKIKNDYREPLLAGQNHYAAFAEMANKVNGKIVQETDRAIEDRFEKSVADYVSGRRTLEQALADFKKRVKNELGF